MEGEWLANGGRVGELLASGGSVRRVVGEWGRVRGAHYLEERVRTVGAGEFSRCGMDHFRMSYFLSS